MTHCQETRQSTEPDAEMIQLMVQSYEDIRIAMIHIKGFTRKGRQLA